MAQTTIYTHAFRNLKRATVGFIAGTVAMVALLSVSFVFSFVGVLIMLFSLLWGFDNLHKLGRAGLEQMTSGMRGSAGLKDAVGGAARRCVIGSTAPRATSNSDSPPVDSGDPASHGFGATFSSG